MNTRKYHRNSMLAFPRTAEYGCAIEKPRTGHRVANWTMVAAVVYLAILLIWELS